MTHHIPRLRISRSISTTSKVPLVGRLYGMSSRLAGTPSTNRPLVRFRLSLTASAPFNLPYPRSPPASTAAANTVDDEPLSSDFSGILGLALPQNSVIASLIPPVAGNQPDGAVFASNLFTMTPSSTAPSSRFLSVTLARPEANGGGIPSQIGIGRHPPDLVPDPSKIQYDVLASDGAGSSAGPFFWEAQLGGVSVWVDGVEKVVDIGSSAAYPGQPPTAVVDSGMPIILATLSIANGIYGALGIGPASDGQCKYLPLQIFRLSALTNILIVPCRLPPMYHSDQHDYCSR